LNYSFNKLKFTAILAYLSDFMKISKFFFAYLSIFERISKKSWKFFAYLSLLCPTDFSTAIFLWVGRGK